MSGDDEGKGRRSGMPGNWTGTKTGAGKTLKASAASATHSDVFQQPPMMPTGLDREFEALTLPRSPETFVFGWVAGSGKRLSALQLTRPNASSSAVEVAHSVLHSSFSAAIRRAYHCAVSVARSGSRSSSFTTQSGDRTGRHRPGSPSESRYTRRAGMARCTGRPQASSEAC